MVIPLFQEGWPLRGFPDMITGPDLGELVAPGNVDDLSNALIGALRKSWDRIRIRDSAKAFDWDRIAEKYFNLYSRVVGLK
jgi:glycosyltransferase involved in cell wall biosynthesis